MQEHLVHCRAVSEVPQQQDLPGESCHGRQRSVKFAAGANGPIASNTAMAWTFRTISVERTRDISERPTSRFMRRSYSQVVIHQSAAQRRTETPDRCKSHSLMADPGLSTTGSSRANATEGPRELCDLCEKGCKWHTEVTSQEESDVRRMRSEALRDTTSHLCAGPRARFRSIQARSRSNPGEAIPLRSPELAE